MTTRPPGDSFGTHLARMRAPLRLAYVGILFLATLSSFRPDLVPAAVLSRLARMLSPSVSSGDAIDGARNVVLFAGWGLLWMVTSAPGRSWVALRNAVLSGAALSLVVELLQLLSRSRTASLLDLTTNTAGSAIGAVALVGVVLSLSSRRGERSFVGVPAAIFAVSCGLAVVGEAFVPLFRQDLEPWAAGGPAARLSDALLRFRWGAFSEWPLGDFFLFLPAGVFGVAALYEAGLSYRRAAALVTLGAVVALCGAEVAHGALGMEILGGAAIVHVLAAASGAALAATGLPAFSRLLRGRQRPGALSLACAVWLLLWFLRPYAPEPTLGGVFAKLTSDWWVPLRLLGSRMDMFSVVDVVGAFFLYLPLGALLAVWPLRLRGVLRGFLPALYFAAGVELAQALVVTRIVDVTDFLVQAAGVLIGWTVVRRAGFRPYGEQLRQSV